MAPVRFSQNDGAGRIGDILSGLLSPSQRIATPGMITPMQKHCDTCLAERSEPALAQAQAPSRATAGDQTDEARHLPELAAPRSRRSRSLLCRNSGAGAPYSHAGLR